MKKLVALILIALQWPLHADVYKCKDASGKISISDQPCPLSSRQESRRDEFVTREQHRKAIGNAESMRRDVAAIERDRCLSAAALAGSKYAVEKATAACHGRTLKDEDDPLLGNSGARIKNCNAWGCYDTSGNYIPRN